MKKLKLLMLGTVLGIGLLSCTNDEGEPEFEILTPEEETQQAGESVSDSTLQTPPLPGE